MNMLIVRLVIYGITVGGILAYYFWHRRQARKNMLRIFHENFNELGALVEKAPQLTREEEEMMIAYFWEVYMVFEGYLLAEYLDTRFPDIAQSAAPWQVRELQYYELLEEHDVNEHQITQLLEMKKCILALEVRDWPGAPYSEEEFFQAHKQKIPLYYETLRELMTLIEGS